MIWIHINGNVAEYTEAERGSSGQYYDLTARIHGNDVWFSNQEYREDGVKFPNWYDTKLEALQAAIDYHETEGCNAYRELYPAPEKGEWDWIAQDENGLWWAYRVKPSCNGRISSWGSYGEMSESPILESPPNPFWRKTLQ